MNLNLYDVVFNLIIETGHPLSTRELTDIINDRGLYHPFDYPLEVNISEVLYHIKKHPELFSRDTTKKPMLIDVINKEHIVSPLPVISNNETNNETNNVEVQTNNKKVFQIVISLIILVIFFIVRAGMTTRDRSDTSNSKADVNNSTNSYSMSPSQDYSWLDGSWYIYFGGGEKYTIVFSASNSDSGLYSATYYGYYGKTSEFGNYSVSNEGRIKLDSSDGYPSYFYIEGNRISDGKGNYLSRK